MLNTIVTDPEILRLMPQHFREATMQPLEQILARTQLQLASEDPPLFTDKLAGAFAADVKYAARVAVNLLEKERTADAILRARDQVAYAAYGADYATQPVRIQARINQLVAVACGAFLVHLQGISEPLRPAQRLALQPEKRQKAGQS